MKVFLDDERPTPAGWHRCYTVKETQEVLLTRQVRVLSLDNDLGDLDPATEGYNIINWLEELVYDDPTFPVPQILIHSSNAARATSMRLAAQKLEWIRQQQVNGS